MNYGYLGIDFDVEDTTEKKIEKKLKVFQRYAKVKPTGQLKICIDSLFYVTKLENIVSKDSYSKISCSISRNFEIFSV